jgi:hypothetical protein
LKEWQNTLGKTQVLPTVYEDLRSNPQSYLDTVTNFVDVPRIRLGPSQINRVLTSEGMTEPRSYYVTRAAQQVAEWSRALRLDSVIAEAKKRGMLKLFVGGGPAFPELPFAERLRLYEIFQPEVEQLECALNRDLSAWKYPCDYQKRVQEADGAATAEQNESASDVAAPLRAPIVDLPAGTPTEGVPVRP